MTRVESRILENDALRIEVSNVGGRLKSVEVLDYRDRIGDGAGAVQLVTESRRGLALVALGDEGFSGFEDLPHEIVSADQNRVVLRLQRGGVEVVRDWRLDERGYGARLQVTVLNHGPGSARPLFDMGWFGRERPTDAKNRFQNYQLVVSANGSLERRMLRSIQSPGMFGSMLGRDAPRGGAYAAPVEWVGVESQYFLAAALPDNPGGSSGSWRPVGPDTGRSGLRYPAVGERALALPPGHQIVRSYRVYLGPKRMEAVKAVDPRLLPATMVGWSWVRPLVELFATALIWTYEHLVPNYGVAIILLTILLRLLTYPLTQRSMKSMKKMQVIAPDMKLIQEKHKGDSQKLQEEMAALYKRTGINPATAIGGGCLPMLLQMPFMLALYFALQGTIELRHAPFMLWINDLSAPEDLFAIAGIPIRVLPLLMGGSMLGQQLLQPATGDAQQRQMMMWMNVVFIFMFYQFPSGLVLYWFVSNLLGIAQQLVINRKPVEAARGKD